MILYIYIDKYICIHKYFTDPQRLSNSTRPMMPSSKCGRVYCIYIYIHTDIIAFYIIYYMIILLYIDVMYIVLFATWHWPTRGEVSMILVKWYYSRGFRIIMDPIMDDSAPSQADAPHGLMGVCPVSHWSFETCAVHVMQSAACVDTTGSKIIIGCTLIELLVSMAFKLAIWQVIQRVSQWDFAAQPQCLRCWETHEQTLYTCFGPGCVC